MTSLKDDHPVHASLIAIGVTIVAKSQNDWKDAIAIGSFVGLIAQTYMSMFGHSIPSFN